MKHTVILDLETLRVLETRSYPDDTAYSPDCHTEFWVPENIDLDDIQVVKTAPHEPPRVILHPDKYEVYWHRVREKRDTLLAKTDYLMLQDIPISEDIVSAYREYRQQLRDLPQNTNVKDPSIIDVSINPKLRDPSEIVWPTEPSKLEQNSIEP